MFTRQGYCYKESSADAYDVKAFVFAKALRRKQDGNQTN